MKHLSESPDRRFFRMTKPNNSAFRITLPPSCYFRPHIIERHALLVE